MKAFVTFKIIIGANVDVVVVDIVVDVVVDVIVDVVVDVVVNVVGLLVGSLSFGKGVNLAGVLVG